MVSGIPAMLMKIADFRLQKTYRHYTFFLLFFFFFWFFCISMTFISMHAQFGDFLSNVKHYAEPCKILLC